MTKRLTTVVKIHNQFVSDLRGWLKLNCQTKNKNTNNDMLQEIIV